MTELFRTVLNMSITGAFISLALIILRAAMKKLPKKYSYALWIILGIRLLCPVSLSSAVSLFNLIKPETAESRMVYVPEDIEYSPVPHITLPPVDEAVNDNMDSLKPGIGDSVNPMQVVMAVCSAVWLMGAAAMAAYTVITYILVYKKVKKALPLQDNVFICREIDSPFVYGIFRPRIYLNDGIPAEEAEFILAHEKAHIRRGDHIVKLIAMAALCIHWFNPLAWLSYKLMTRDMELSCDEIAVNGFDRDVRKEYAETLLNMSMRQNKIVLGGILAFGESSIKTRIKSVLSAKKPRVAVTVIAIAAVAVSSFCLLTNASSGTFPRKPVYAEIAQITTLAASGDDELREADGAEAVKLINKLSLTEITEEYAGDMPYPTSYTLMLYYDKDMNEYDTVSILSPVHYADGKYSSDYTYDGAKIMAVESSDGEARLYSLSDGDYDRLSAFMTGYFEKFPPGRYINTDTSEELFITEDGVFDRRFEDGGIFYNWGMPKEYEANGLRVLLEGNSSGRCALYLGNGQIVIDNVFPDIPDRIEGIFVKTEGISALDPPMKTMRPDDVYVAGVQRGNGGAHGAAWDASGITEALNSAEYTRVNTSYVPVLIGDTTLTFTTDPSDINGVLTLGLWEKDGKYYIHILDRGIAVYELSRKDYENIMSRCDEILNNGFNDQIYDKFGISFICLDYLRDYWNYFMKLGDLKPEKYISDAAMLRYVNSWKEENSDVLARGITGFQISVRNLQNGFTKEKRPWLAFVYDLEMILDEKTAAEEGADDCYKNYTAYFELESEGWEMKIYRAYQLHELGIFGSPAQGVEYPLEVDIDSLTYRNRH